MGQFVTDEELAHGSKLTKAERREERVVKLTWQIQRHGIESLSQDDVDFLSDVLDGLKIR